MQDSKINSSATLGETQISRRIRKKTVRRPKNAQGNFSCLESAYSQDKRIPENQIHPCRRQQKEMVGICCVHKDTSNANGNDVSWHPSSKTRRPMLELIINIVCVIFPQSEPCQGSVLEPCTCWPNGLTLSKTEDGQLETL